MTLAELLEALKQRQIHVFSDAGQLRIKAPKGALTPELREHLKAHKAKLLDFLSSASQKDADKAPPLEPADRSQPIPLSFAQQRLWFIDQLDPGNPAYNIFTAQRISGFFDGDLLQQALTAIVTRHEVLRTCFPMGEDDQPIQHIHPPCPFDLERTDLSAIDHNQALAQAMARVKAETHFRFDLANGPLLRCQLVKLADDDHVMIINMHHIVSDGWSITLFMGELGRHLSMLAQTGSTASLKALAIQYADFSVWQRNWLEGGELERQLGFWKKTLAGAPTLLELPTDKVRPKRNALRGARMGFEIPASLGERLNKLSQQEGATLFMALMAAFQTLLARYSNQRDILVGLPIANRNRGETESLIGFFANTLVLRSDFHDNPSFKELIRQVHASAIAAYDHQDVPFERVVDELDIERNLSYNPLFQAVFQLVNAPKESQQAKGPLQFQSLDDSRETAHFDLKLTVVERGHQAWTGSFEYNTDIFIASTIERMIGHLRRILETMVGTPETKVLSHALPDAAERQHLIEARNPAPKETPGANCIHHIFARIAEQSPERLAVSYQDQRLTYRELSTKANKIAHALQAKGAEADVIVGLFCQRDHLLVPGLLSILKAGAAYLPLDPVHPEDRIQYMIEDAGVRLILTTRELQAKLPTHQAEVVLIEDLLEAEGPEHNPETHTLPKHCAYVIYTSGSTGRPKGVMNTHANATRLMTATEAWFHFDETDVWTLFHAFSFDFSVWELWGPLLYGGHLVVVPYLISRDPEAFYNLLADEGVTVLNQTPSAFKQLMLVEDESHKRRELALRHIIFGGEALEPPALRPWFERHGDATPRIINMYGITETCVHVTYRPISEADTKGGISPIGIPIPDLQLYVLDPFMNPAPTGVPGELCVGGAGLARGYLGRPDLTATRFVPDPYSGNSGARLYRSGDLARVLANDELVYMGRMDHQVKIRGFRIELGEIENGMASFAGVSNAVVLVREDIPGDQRLVGYIASGGNAIDEAALRQHLAGLMPEYMIPNDFVVLDQFPLTPNGKTDRRKLPAPERKASSEAAYVAPRNAAETEMTAIWQDILSAERIGIHDHFFEMGGHSLLATKLMARVRRTFQVELPLAALFEHPTVAGLMAAVSTAKSQHGDQAMPVLQPLPRTESGLPLSFAQNRLWFIDQLDPGNPVYNIPIALEINGPFSADILGPALDLLVERHESLRTTFQLGEQEPMQHILPAQKDQLVVTDLSQFDGDLEAEIKQRVIEASNQRFDLAAAPPWQCQLLVINDTRHVMIFVMHHIISDGWSMQVLARDLGAYCDAFAESKPAPLPPLPIQYADFATWQRLWLEGGELQRQLDFWKDRLAHPTTLELPTDRPRPKLLSHDGDRHLFALDGRIQRQLEALAENTKTTPFMVLLAGFQVLLARYSGQQDILVGTPIANRSRAELEHLLGFFVNTLVMRADLSQVQSFTELLSQTRATALAAYSHQDLPFEKLVEEMKLERDLGRNPLFQVVFTYVPKGESSDEMPVSMRMLEYDRGMAHFDLHLTINQTSKGLNGLINYNTQLFDQSTIERLGQHFQSLMLQLLARPDAPLQQASILAATERRQVLEDWNQTQVDYPQATIAQVFEDQVAQTPTHIAILSGQQQITYADLNKRANQIAHALIARGVAPETTVGLVMERGHEMVASILGILKAGAAFVPIDTNLPPDRVAFIIDNADVRFFLTQAKIRHHIDFAEEGGFEVLDLDKHAAAIRALPTTNAAARGFADSLCYIMFTSGSTGTAKGVAAVNRGVVRLVKGANFADLSPEQTFMLYAPVFFDASTLEIWAALLNGGKLAIAPPQAVGLQELGGLINDYGVTTMWLTAGLFHQMVDEHLDGLRGLKQLLAGGDALALPQVRRVLDELDGVTMINGYGPTENTTFTTCHTMTSSAGLTHTVPIGSAISNTTVYVLDQQLEPVAIGINGELFTGGAGLARGYMNRPDLTAERFMPNPYDGVAGARMYRTGDLVKRRSDGAIEFIGRRDFQVKLRGFRIELGEIETVLNEHPLLATSLVLLREDTPGDKRLVAYLIHAEAELKEEKPATAAIRDYLEEKLPAYMVPSAFIWLEAFPLNANGKVDRKKLPVPERRHLGLEDQYVAPRNGTEEALVEIWEDLLNLERVGATDNFFEVGGHSLLATRLVSQIRETFEVELALREVFERPTVALLAQRISELSGSGQVALPPIVAQNRNQPIPLSFAQQRLWFIDQMEPGNPAYNIYNAIKVTGDFKLDILEQAINRLVQRHESLRTTFAFEDNRPWQIVHAEKPVTLERIDLHHLPSEKAWQKVDQIMRQEVKHRFSLEQGPLLRISVITVHEDVFLMQLCMHHIISDGWSMGILIGELSAIYAALAQGQDPYLEPLPVQYPDFAIWQRQHLEGSHLQRQVAFWQSQLADLEPLQLPTDRPRPKVQTHNGRLFQFRLESQDIQPLYELGRTRGATPFMSLLTAFKLLLMRYTNQADIAVGTPVSGRNRGEVEPLIGFFVNTLVLRSSFSESDDFNAALDRVHQSTLDAFSHQDLTFEKLVEALQLPRDTSRNPLFDVMFSYHSGRQSLDPGAQQDRGDLRFESYGGDRQMAHFDLTLNASESGKAMVCNFEYNTDLFDHETIAAMASHLRRLIAQITQKPQAVVTSLDLLNDAERQKLLQDWNGQPLVTQAATLPPILETQARQIPDKVAVRFSETVGGQSYTYQQLNHKANQLANWLTQQGLHRESTVALYLERSHHLPIAIWAVLKASGCFMMLDRNHPKDRRDFMLADTHTQLILTTATLADELSDIDVPVHDLDQLLPQLADTPAENPAQQPTPQQLAYIIYTSGSTGRPKGVGVNHQNLYNYLQQNQLRRDLKGDDICLQFAALSFDISVAEQFNAWFTGSTLVYRDERVMEGLDQFASFAESHQISIFDLPTAYWNSWTFALDHGGVTIPASTRLVIAGGEKADRALLETWFKHAGRTCTYINSYGPTEATIDAVNFHVTQLDDLPDGLVPIGHINPGYRGYVVDPQLRLVPPGVAGELLLGGKSVSRGYVNRPELTAAAFIPDSFGETPGARLYRTGDLVRFNKDGCLVYLGRIDAQVKVRGFRIEPGEIENLLNQLDDVAQVVVSARKDPNGLQRLVAHLETSHAYTAEALRSHLEGHLPEYMIPDAFVTLEAFPMTSGGKVNRRALPDPEYSSSDNYVAPRNAQEAELAAIWAEVLGVGQIGIHDNFFHNGGHSLLATVLVGRIRQQLQVDVPLAAVFSSPTVLAMNQLIQDLHAQGKRLDLPAMDRVDRNQALSLSFAQQRLWFIDQLDPGNRAYLMPQAFEIRGSFDSDLFTQAINAVVARHESLRTAFLQQGTQAQQIVMPEVTLDVPLIDLSEKPATDRENLAKKHIDQAMNQSFDLTQAPLIRALVCRLGDERHVIGICMHHIISDGWSHNVFLRELFTYYQSFAQDVTPPLKPLTLHYPDFAAWQRDYLSGERLASLRSFWLDTFANLPDPLEIPGDRPRPKMQTFNGDSVDLKLSADQGAQIQSLARELGATNFMVMLAGFNALLARYTSREDLLVGTPIANRTHPETEQMIGFFVNTLVMRNDLSGNPSFRELVERVKANALKAYTHQDMPFDMIVNELGLPRDMGRNPLFQVMFVYNKAGQGEAAELTEGGIQFKSFDFRRQLAHFDLTLTVNEGGKGAMNVGFTYNTDLYDRATIERMAHHFETLITRMCSHLDEHLYSHTLLGQSEIERLHQWNLTQRDFEIDALTQVFDQRVAEHPDKTALVFRDERISYAELQRRANQLANVLRAHGVLHETHVGLAMHRSPELVVAILAVLKAGAIYVPLDANLPKDRIHFMLDATATPLVIYTQDWLEADSTEAAFGSRQALDLETLSQEIKQASSEAPAIAIAADQLAYVMFTSGSTGQPKGVSIPHRGILRLVRNNASLPVDPNAIGMFLAPTHFDASTLELWTNLLNGCTMCIFPDRVPELASLGNFIVEHGIDNIFLTAALMHQMAESQAPAFAKVKQLSSGGDVLSPSHIAQLQAVNPQLTVINCYGPTENTVITTSYTIPSGHPANQAIPIGTPISNTQTFILDKGLHPVPVGIPGELYTSGDGLARCYAQRADLTAERFMPAIYGEAGGRMYKTGDLVRYDHDGLVHFMGRLDFQVKIRGFRIEMGEIENVLAKLPDVNQTLVVANSDNQGGKRLVAYMTTDLAETDQPSNSDLRQALANDLPDYMIPAAFVWLASFPMTSSGKVDRRALPAPKFSSDAEYVAPSNETETALCAMYAELLEVEQVGINDNFFELGGHSLMATRLVSLIRATFNVEFALREIFERPTVGQQAKRIDELLGSGQTALPPIVAQGRTQPIPLSFAQQRLWVIDQMDPGNPAYNISSALKITGPFNLNVLEKAFNLLVERHESLRTTFAFADQQPRQVVQTIWPQTIARHDLRHLPKAQAWQQVEQIVAADAKFRFSLEHGPLIRISAAIPEDDITVLQLCMHHIISDGWSMGILIGELSALFAALSQDETPHLPALAVQYPDYALWQRQYLEGEHLDRQIVFWQDTLFGIEPLPLPTDRPRPQVQTNRGRLLEFRLEAEEIQPLFKLGSQQGATAFMTLLTAFKLLLMRYTNRTDIAVGTPVSGRNRHEVEQLIGFFVNTLVLRSKFDYSADFMAAIDTVQQTTLSAFSHQDVTFEKLVEAMKLPRDTSRNPLFDVMFSYHSGAPNAEAEAQSDRGDLKFESYGTAHEMAQFDLTLNASEAGDAVICNFEYNTDLFDHQTIEAMAMHMRNLVTRLAQQPNQPLHQLTVIDDQERSRLLTAWNGKPVTAEAKTLPSILEAHAVQTPDKIAVVFSEQAGGQSYSYQQLNHKANQLAHWLTQNSMGPESTVALFLERSHHLPIAIWAVLKAGGCFMMLDPNLPADRRDYMLTDSQCQMILTSSDLQSSLTNTDFPVHDLDDLLPQLQDQPGDNPAANCQLQQLAYIIYTSGSTGRPKGVAVTHQNLYTYIHQTQQRRGYRSEDVCLQFAALSFDISVAEQFNAWFTGATLVYRDQQVMEGLDHFITFAETHKVTIFDLPTAYWNTWAETLEHGNIHIPNSARLIIAGGEKADRALLDSWFKHGGTNCTYINSYGPTEATIDAVNFHVANPDDLPAGPVPIGQINPGYKGYVVDRLFQLLPPGVAGELVLGGPAIVRGYVNSPALTAAAFTPDPFSETPGARLYRTGDLVRFNRQGQLVFMGRIDDQVKIRGFRIEPGEIEKVLVAREEVKQALVLATNDAAGGKRLVAYMTTDLGENERASHNDLRLQLADDLPDYMIPAALIWLESFPVTVNGKVDLRALPAPEFASTNYVAPRDETEKVLCELYAKLLDVNQVGIHDNFFELGGHSLLATRLTASIQQQLGVKLPINLLFQHGSVAALAAAIEARKSASTAAWTPLVRINQQSEGQPIFIVHPVGGGVLCYRELGLALDAARPAYALEAKGTEHGEAVDNIETMASSYIAAIKQVQAEGPYQLAGWSLGGIVAWEMARQLEAEGQAARLVLIDSYATITNQQYSDRDIAVGFIQDYSRLMGVRLSLPGTISGATEAEKEQNFLDALAQQGAIRDAADREQFARQFKVFAANLTAVGAYQLKALQQADALLIKASDNQDRDHGWQALLSDQSAQAMVTGDHFSILRGSSAIELSDIIEKHLRGI